MLAQRLVRVFCKQLHGKGCGNCRGTGFKGRKAIGELLVLNDELRELIVARAPARKLKEAARPPARVPLREAAHAAGATPAKPHSRRSTVSLLWRNHLRIGLCRGPPVLAPTARPEPRAGPASCRSRSSRAIPSGAPPLEALPAASWPSRRHYEVSVVLADQFVRYALLPWNAALKSDEQWLALARHRFGARARRRAPPNGT